MPNKNIITESSHVTPADTVIPALLMKTQHWKICDDANLDFLGRKCNKTCTKNLFFRMIAEGTIPFAELMKECTIWMTYHLSENLTEAYRSIMTMVKSNISHLDQR